MTKESEVDLIQEVSRARGKPHPSSYWSQSDRYKVRGADDLFLDHFRARKEPKQIGLKSQPLVSQPSSNI